MAPWIGKVRSASIDAAVGEVNGVRSGARAKGRANRTQRRSSPGSLGPLHAPVAQLDRASGFEPEGDLRPRREQIEGAFGDLSAGHRSRRGRARHGGRPARAFRRERRYSRPAFRGMCAPVAQLDRASGFEPEGRGFESLPACQSFQVVRPLSRDDPQVPDLRVVAPLVRRRSRESTCCGHLAASISGANAGAIRRRRPGFTPREAASRSSALRSGRTRSSRPRRRTRRRAPRCRVQDPRQPGPSRGRGVRKPLRKHAARPAYWWTTCQSTPKGAMASPSPSRKRMQISEGRLR